jgi:mannitol-specific phosphotransferase system IIBC component
MKSLPYLTFAACGCIAAFFVQSAYSPDQRNAGALFFSLAAIVLPVLIQMRSSGVRDSR